MSAHYPPRVGGLGTVVPSVHVYETVMDAGYDTARLILEKEPVLNYTARIHKFLSYPVKERSLEQLHSDYLELSEGMGQKEKEFLEVSYLAGWAHHDAAEALNWVSTNVVDKSRRQEIYQQVLKTDTDKVMNLMLAKHGEPDYETMMVSIAESKSSLTPNQIERFHAKNQYEPANTPRLVVITESRIEMPIFSTRRLPTYDLKSYEPGSTFRVPAATSRAKPEAPLVIPRR